MQWEFIKLILIAKFLISLHPLGNADIISNYCNTAPKQWLVRCEIIDNIIEENEGYMEELTWLVVC